MSQRREPVLIPVAIADLRPTQMTVGYREVKRKRDHWQKLGKDGGVYLGQHMLPVVLGPKGRSYVIDHHHLARALLEEGQDEVLTTVITDLSSLEKDAFWLFLDLKNWTHPYDAKGIRQPLTALPKRIGDMADDPYRSLAGMVRENGGFAKDITPFSEFIWADYFRRRIPAGGLAKDFDASLATAMALARAKDASFMPGWCGAD